MYFWEFWSKLQCQENMYQWTMVMQWPYKTYAKHLLPRKCICIHRKPYVYSFWVNEINQYKCYFCYTIDGSKFMDGRAGTGWVLHVLMMRADFQSRLFLE